MPNMREKKMPPKTFQPRINRDSNNRGRSNSGDSEINAHINNLSLDKKAHKALRTSAYVTPDGQYDNDLDYIDPPAPEPKMVRPQIQAMYETLEKFNDPKRAAIAAKNRANPKGWVTCSICGKCTTPDREVMAEHFIDSDEDRGHPETYRYFRFLLDKVQSPWKHFNDRLDELQQEYEQQDYNVKRVEKLVKVLAENKQRILEKYGITQAAQDYGKHSIEYETALAKAAERLEPIENKLNEAKQALGVYSQRRHEAEWYFNIASRKLAELENDPFIKPLLVPVPTGSNTEKLQFEIDLEMMQDLIHARAQWMQKQMSGVVSPTPSKGALYKDQNPYTTEQIQNWQPDASGTPGAD
jgi:hypothetical protein